MKSEEERKALRKQLNYYGISFEMFTLDTPEDAIAFAQYQQRTRYSINLAQYAFEESFSGRPLGDKCWTFLDFRVIGSREREQILKEKRREPGRIMFVKGNIFVDLRVGRTEEGKSASKRISPEYTESIARIIEAKLK